MGKYLLQGSYTADGVKGLMKETASGRRQVIDSVLKGLGGRLESMYFTFGESDVILIADLPDNITVAALGMAVGASGSVRTRTTVLLTTEEVDQAAKKPVNYRPPGR